MNPSFHLLLLHKNLAFLFQWARTMDLDWWTLWKWLNTQRNGNLYLHSSLVKSTSISRGNYPISRMSSPVGNSTNFYCLSRFSWDQTKNQPRLNAIQSFAHGGIQCFPQQTGRGNQISIYHHKGYRRRSYPQDGAVIYEIKLIVLNTVAMLQSVAVNKKLP